MPTKPTEWYPRAEPPPLAADEIHVWHARLAALPCRRDWLADGERARLGSATPPTDFCATRSLLRHLLGHYLGCTPQAVPIVLAPSGKPALREDLLHFNLSHAGGQLLIAVSRDLSLGIDCESPRPLRHAERIARRLFDADDYRAWEAGGRDPAHFFRLWTAMEARQKCLGGGLFGQRPTGTPPACRTFEVAGLPACLAWQPASRQPRVSLWRWNGKL